MKTIFWNVDTQYDFMRDDETFKGALPVPGARKIEGNLETLTRLAEEREVQVVNTGDWHTMADREISLTPDFVNTYNPHCMKNTRGAEYVPATKPKNPYVISWQDKEFDEREVQTRRELVLYKNEFGVFDGNQYAEKVVDLIKPNRVILYGVALNVCDNFAVLGLRKKNIEVYAIIDAMKDLPHLKGTALDTDRVLKNWEDLGVKFIDTKDVATLLN